jgi:hypothetical protein
MALMRLCDILDPDFLLPFTLKIGRLLVFREYIWMWTPSSANKFTKIFAVRSSNFPKSPS